MVQCMQVFPDYNFIFLKSYMALGQNGISADGSHDEFQVLDHKLIDGMMLYL